MANNETVILYIGCVLPCRTETFVYREIFALRKQGTKVHIASIHEPQRNLGNATLDRLADEALCIYSKGLLRLLSRFTLECYQRTRKTIRSLLFACKLATKKANASALQRLKLVWHAFVAISIAKDVAELGVTHIHAHMAHVPTSIALFLSKHLDLPYSFTGHAVDLFKDRSFLEEKLFHASFCACISEWHRNFYKFLVDIENSRLPIVRCGIDVETFHPSSVTEKKIHILSVGRLIPKKGLDSLVKALNLLKTERIEWQCDIVGEGPERQKLESLIRTDRIRLLGPKNNDDVRQMIQRSDIFVLPCRVDDDGDRDGIPVSVMEAMACEVPVISGTLPTIEELIQPGVNGILIPPDDTKELAHSIHRLIESPTLRKQYGRCGRKRILEEFSLPLNIGRLQKAFLGASKE